MKLPSPHLYAQLAGKPRRVSLTLFYALAGSAVAIVFLKGTHWLYNSIYPALARQGMWVFLGGSLAAIVISSLLVGLLLGKVRPDAAGSGIPQLKAAYWYDMGRLPWRAAWVKVVAGVISLGGGASLGREGPTVYASGAAASALAGALRISPVQRRAASLAGAAAGLAAAFNTPLAAITFVLEEILDDLDSRHLGPALLAAVTGAFCTWVACGRNPAFAVPGVDAVTWRSYLLAPLAATLAAGAAIAFQQSTLRLRLRIRARSDVPAMLRPLVGGMCVWALGAAVFLLSGRLGVFSLGYDDLAAALAGNVAWRVALLLLAAKLAATVLAYAWGGCGGIFAPTLFLGAMAGLVVAGFARVSGMALGDDADLLLALVGMSACFGATVRAPLTALLMVFEMTHRYEIVPALMIGTAVSQACARLFGGRWNFYDAVLEQDGIVPPKALTTGRATGKATV
ncbi:MAG: chloride channel protein [Kiritimatiellae bacterium]|nr:chloride channel protein [Kiritimatiellia bacterium]